MFKGTLKIKIFNNLNCLIDITNRDNLVILNFGTTILLKRHIRQSLKTSNARTFLNSYALK